MKRTAVLVLITAVIMGFAACSGQAPEAQTAAPIISETAAVTPSPADQPEPSTEDEGTPDITITEGPMPGLLGSGWYDWDKVGAYPGASVTQCGDRIAFQMLEYRGEMDYDSYLTFAGPDGSNAVSTEIEDPRDPNYKDGWVYFISDNDNSINKVRTDGKGLKRIYKMKSGLPETKDIYLSDILLIEDKIYAFENIHYGEKYKIIIKRMGFDGIGIETLSEFEHPEVNSEMAFADYLPSFFYDSGKLYYTDTDLANSRFDLYTYDLATGGKACIKKGLAAELSSKIAVRGDEVYYDTEKGMRVYTVSTDKDEEFAPARGIDFMDFAFFDRWLLMSSDEGLYSYDMDSGKIYLSEDAGCAMIMPTRNYLYFESPDDFPFLEPITFEGGGFFQNDDINTTE